MNLNTVDLKSVENAKKLIELAVLQAKLILPTKIQNAINDTESCEFDLLSIQTDGLVFRRVIDDKDLMFMNWNNNNNNNSNNNNNRHIQVSTEVKNHKVLIKKSLEYSGRFGLYINGCFIDSEEDKQAITRLQTRIQNALQKNIEVKESVSPIEKLRQACIECKETGVDITSILNIVYSESTLNQEDVNKIGY